MSHGWLVVTLLMMSFQLCRSCAIRYAAVTDKPVDSLIPSIQRVFCLPLLRCPIFLEQLSSLGSRLPFVRYDQSTAVCYEQFYDIMECTLLLGIWQIHLFCALSKKFSASSSNTTFQRPGLYFGLLFQLPMSQTHTWQSGRPGHSWYSSLLFWWFPVLPDICESNSSCPSHCQTSSNFLGAATLIHNDWSKKVECIDHLYVLSICLHWLVWAAAIYHDLCFFHIKEQSILFTCALHSVNEVLEFWSCSCNESGIISIPKIG